MSRIFLLGSEEEMVVQRANFEVNIERHISKPILCDEGDRETKAREYLADARIVERRIIAADYGTTPDGLGITVTLWFRTSKDL